MNTKIHQILFHKYGTEPSEKILERVRTELAFLRKQDDLGELAELDDFISKCRVAQKPFVGVGLCSTSLVLNLLDITNCNPLPPHYYCPECKTVEWAEAKNGFDLPPKDCKCGFPLVRDGHGIPHEQLTAKKYTKSPFRFHISKRMYDRLPDFFGYFREEDYEGGKIGIGNRLCTFFVNDEVYFKGQKYGRSYEPKISDICKSFREHLKERFDVEVPGEASFSELLFEYGRTRGRRRSEDPKDIRVLFREDLLSLLLSRGAEPAMAARAALYAAAGHGVHEGIQMGLTDAEKEQIKEGRFMPSKGLAIEWQCYIARIK